MEKTFEQCCDEVAKKYKYPNWRNVIHDLFDSGIDINTLESMEKEAAELYAQSRESLLKEEVERLKEQLKIEILANENVRSELHASKKEITKLGDIVVDLGKSLLNPNEKERLEELEQKNKEMEEQLDLAIHGGNVFKNQADELKQVLKNFYEGFVSQFPKPPDYENIEKLLKQ